MPEPRGTYGTGVDIAERISRPSGPRIWCCTACNRRRLKDCPGWWSICCPECFEPMEIEREFPPWWRVDYPRNALYMIVRSRRNGREIVRWVGIETITLCAIDPTEYAERVALEELSRDA